MTAIHRPARRHLLLQAAAALAAPSVRAAPAAIRVGGTGAALALLRLLGSAYAAAGGNAVLEVLPSLGTGGGLRALQGRVIGIAVSTRPLSPAETAAGLRGTDLAHTAMAFTTRAQSRVGDLSLPAVAAFFSGEQLSWPDGEPVRVIRRPPNEADWIALARLGPEMDRAVQLALRRPGLLVAGSDQENAELIEGVPGSFGLISQGQACAEARRVKLLTLDGAAPSPAGVRTGSWPIARSLHLATLAEADPEVERFLAFTQGETAAALMRSHEFLPARDLQP